MTIILETDSSVEIEIDAPETLHCTETKIIEEETDTEITL